MSEDVSFEDYIVALAYDYRAKCALVEPAWLNLLQTIVNSGDRARAQLLYREATESAKSARDALLNHVRGDAMEVGQ